MADFWKILGNRAGNVVWPPSMYFWTLNSNMVLFFWKFSKFQPKSAIFRKMADFWKTPWNKSNECGQTPKQVHFDARIDYGIIFWKLSKFQPKSAILKNFKKWARSIVWSPSRYFQSLNLNIALFFDNSQNLSQNLPFFRKMADS